MEKINAAAANPDPIQGIEQLKAVASNPKLNDLSPDSLKVIRSALTAVEQTLAGESQGMASGS